MRSLIRSARVWMVKGMAPPQARTACANSVTQSTRKPKMSSANQTWSGEWRALEMGHFRGDFRGAALQVLVAPDGLGAPGAPERAAPRGGHVEAEVSVRFAPDRAVALDIDQIPGRRHRLFEGGRGGPRRALVLTASSDQGREPDETLESAAPPRESGSRPAAVSAPSRSRDLRPGGPHRRPRADRAPEHRWRPSPRRSPARRSARALAIISQQASRILPRHILLRKLKLSS